MLNKNPFLKKIIDEIMNNPKITEKEIAILIDRDERTVRRYFKMLKDNGIIKLYNRGKKRNWQVIKKG